MEKRHVDRRLDQMRAEGTEFRTASTSASTSPPPSCASSSTRWCWRAARPAWRDLPVTGRDAVGVYQAMEYLPPANKVAGGRLATIDHAGGKHVVVIGGGDTGADCIGTAHPPGRRRR